MPHANLLTAFFVLVACSVAAAQSADYASISEDSRRTLILTLALDEEQTETLDDLIEGYDADADAISQRFLRRSAALEERDLERARRFGARKELEVERDRRLIENRELLLDDLALVLDEDQAERVEAARLRFRRAPLFEELSGDASGFTADPVRVAEELALYDTLTPEEFERFEGAMRSYDGFIDRRLARFLDIRAAFAGEVADDGEEARQDAADEYVESMIGATIDLRSAHASLLTSIAGSLPSPLDERWRETATRLSHPDVFVDAWGERTIDALLASDALVESEREEVRSVAERFAPRYERARVRIARQIEEAEGRVTVEQAKRSSFITINDPAVAEARAALGALNASVRRLLVSAIDPAIQDLVPPLPGGAE